MFVDSSKRSNCLAGQQVSPLYLVEHIRMAYKRSKHLVAGLLASLRSCCVILAMFSISPALS